MPTKPDPLDGVDPDLFVRVKDRDTGHEYDVRARNVKPGLQEVVKLDEYPPTQRPRRPKHYVGKGGEPAAPNQES